MRNNEKPFDERIDKIKERIIFYLICFEETDSEIYKNQYLLYMGYWEGVLQKMK